MIRQFLATTVENLRSFISSLSRPGSSGASASTAPTDNADSETQRRRRAAGLAPRRVEGPVENPEEPRAAEPDTNEPSPPLLQEPAAQRESAQRESMQGQPAPEQPQQKESPRRTAHARPSVPARQTPPATDATAPAPTSDAPQDASQNSSQDALGDAHADNRSKEGQRKEVHSREHPAPATSPLARTEHAPPKTELPDTRPEHEVTLRRRPPQRFPTQSVPALPAVPLDETPAPESPVQEEHDGGQEAPQENPQEEPEFPQSEPVPHADGAPVSDGVSGGVSETPPEAVNGAQPSSTQPPNIPPPSAEPYGELQTVLESLLFVSGEPVGLTQLARALEMDQETVAEELNTLAQTYARQNRGLRIQAHRDKYQIVTAPAAAPHIERFLNLDTSSKLSGPALETLAVIAYRQPVTRSQIEAVRGVDCAAVLRSLAQRGLIEEVGRLDVVGRPILYGVTDYFMQHFGLTDLGELPPLEQTEADTLWAATALAELEGESADNAATDTASTDSAPESPEHTANEQTGDELSPEVASADQDPRPQNPTRQNSVKQDTPTGHTSAQDKSD